MPHRTLLSPEQRTRVLGIPTEAAEMAKHYVLSTEDLALVRTKRRLSNRLGFAVQLCAFGTPAAPSSGRNYRRQPCWLLLPTRWAPIRNCLGITRIGPRHAGSICSNYSSTCACAASAWRIGALA
jgi:hypothetical protein